jgi:hypothetical protein
MFEPKTLRHFEYELSVMLKAATDQDPEGLAEIEGLLRRTLDQGIPAAAEQQRARHGFSWADFGRAFGVTAWAARKRLGAKPAATTEAA